MISTLGEIIFHVSSNRILTFDNLSIESNSRWAEHSGQDIPELEFTGDGLDSFSFTIKSSVYLKSDPKYVSNRLTRYKSTGDPQRLILGGLVFKNKQWVIQSFTESWKKVDNWGRPLVVDFSIQLKEYSRGKENYVETLENYKAKGVKKIKEFSKNINYNTGGFF